MTYLAFSDRAENRLYLWDWDWKIEWVCLEGEFWFV
jgi:hypothetical protein